MKRHNPNQLELGLAPGGALGPTPLSRATARRGSRRFEAPAPMPWQCVVLAVDTARQSGWAIYCLGKLCEYGEVDTLHDATLAQIVQNALDYAAGSVRAVPAAVPCVLVLEAPFGGSVEVVAALGAARERWQLAWRQHEQAPGRIVRVQPSTWRGPVLGSEWIGANRYAVRAQELLIARAFVEQSNRRAIERAVAGVTRVAPLGHDEAAAILIGRWAAHAAAVGRVIGKRAARASLRAWTRGATP